MQHGICSARLFGTLPSRHLKKKHPHLGPEQKGWTAALFFGNVVLYGPAYIPKTTRTRRLRTALLKCRLSFAPSQQSSTSRDASRRQNGVLVCV
jgi:hypothetical protein